MQFFRSGIAGVAVLAALAALLLGGCDLREGASNEYGSSYGSDGLNAETMGKELPI